MKEKPLTISHSVATHYFEDARDFSSRFDILWENKLHKTGRIKSFIDLMMGCECILKAHIFIGRSNEDINALYRNVRNKGHRIDLLADYSNYLTDKTIYRKLKTELGGFSVFFRYSLDAYETFFPSALDWEDSEINYSETIGNSHWVSNLRENLAKLIDIISPEFTGFVTSDIRIILEHEEQMEFFAQNHIRKGTTRNQKE